MPPFLMAMLTDRYSCGIIDQKGTVMELFICGLEKVPGMIHLHGITHVLSLLRGRERNELVLPPEFSRDNWLLLDMDDVISEEADFAPRIDQVKRFLEWGKGLPQDARVLVHCRAGVSRSTSAALALKVQEIGIHRIDQAIEWLVDHRPIACPNPIISKHADQLLGAGGELFAKAERVANAKLLKLYGGSAEIVSNIRNNIGQ